MRLLGIDAAPIGGDRGDCLQWFWGTRSPRAAAVAERQRLEPVYTTVVLRPPATKDDPGVLSGAVASLLASRPAGERVALWSWGSSLATIADFTTDREWLIHQATRYYDTSDPNASSVPMAADEVVKTLRTLMARVGGEARRGMRSVVIFGRDVPDIPAARPSSESASFQWVVGGLSPEQIESLGEGSVVPWERSSLLTDSMSEVSARLDALATDGFYSVGSCGNGDAARVIIAAGELAAPVSTDLAPVPLDERALSCDPVAVATAQRKYPARIGFEFSGPQRALYDDRVASGSKEDFGVAVRVWPGGGLAPATAHLRGRNSLGCERKSFTLRFDEALSRHLVPSGANREWCLIAPCLDDAYVSSLFGYTVMARLGVFLPAFRLVELQMDGETQGFYLLIDKVAESLVRDHGSLRSVIRRANDSRGEGAGDQGRPP